VPDGELPARALRHQEPVSRLPPRLVASWQRSEDYGVSLDEIQPVFTGTRGPDSLFYECGQRVLGALHRTIADEPISLMLTDPAGLVLNRFCGDTNLLQALDAVHLAPGFAYSERAAGTNGLGLALADRAPTVVHAEEHYARSLCTYTCAASPVFDPFTGRLEGCVNLTTWSRSPTSLLLALAQSAAENTSALMLARAQGHRPRPPARGEVFHVLAPQLEPGSGSVQSLATVWTSAVARAVDAISAGRVSAAVGEPGCGRTTLLAQAQRRYRARQRILAAGVPEAQDVQTWLSLWTPELAKAETAIIVRDADRLPQWAAERLHDCAARAGASLSMTATRFEDIPAPLAALVQTIVQVPPLRERPADVLPLAGHLARRARGRQITFTPAAAHALRDHGWPENVSELAAAVTDAAHRADVIDVCHLPPSVLSHSTHRLTRIEALERDELVRVLTAPGSTVAHAAEELGMSRATVYRKLAVYGIRTPRAGAAHS
jgi:transcriptional regulator of acetoin/glycerol metabolism